MDNIVERKKKYAFYRLAREDEYTRLTEIEEDKFLLVEVNNLFFVDKGMSIDLY